ncbi:Laccase abr2 [Ceratocystis fimbriata CBS 114723]|uniref:Laccase abr2 n=1 Tax=Ceratocystis fimbriata CBS 114723 TaxID=1035309 RepID=A0A2C5XAT1_9PEZI|nr:Laccase abr2 [Ceratocystis fimbriata CBS 114723]
MTSFPLYLLAVQLLLLSLAGLTSAKPALPHLLNCPANGHHGSGQPRVFNLDITWEDHAPDGFVRKQFLVNGSFPGPTLEMNQGDQVRVVVRNRSPFNTTIHCHGIEMLNTPWADGVPGVSQRHIQPGHSYTYAFNATQYGSYWYHSHTMGQIDDGLLGAIVIHPGKSTPTPYHLIANCGKDSLEAADIAAAVAGVQPLLLSDWQHMTSMERHDVSLESGIEMPCYDSLLFNGQGSIQCLPQAEIDALTDDAQRAFLTRGGGSRLTAKGCLPGDVVGKVLAAGFSTNLSAIPPTIFDTCVNSSGSQAVLSYSAPAQSKINLGIKLGSSKAATKGPSGTWVALDLIGAFGLLTASFSIDETPMWVYAVDGAFIVPQKVDAITISLGARYSIAFKLSSPGIYPMRLASVTTAQTLAAHAILEYSTPSQEAQVAASQRGPTVASITPRGAGVDPSVVFFNQSDIKAYPPQAVSPTVDQTVIMYMRVAGHAHEWALNSTIYPMALDMVASPLLFAPDPQRLNNVTITTLNDTWVDVIFVTDTYPMPAHPIHKHSNKMFLIGQGHGAWKWDSVDEAMADMPDQFNLVDPPHRDTVETLDAEKEPSWIVVRYHVVNPGAFMLHCHIETHLVGGMAVVIQDGIDKWPSVPEEFLAMA